MPVKVKYNWGNVLKFTSLSHDSGGSVLNILKLPQLHFRTTVEQGIAILWFRCYKSMHSNFARLLREIFSYL